MEEDAAADVATSKKKGSKLRTRKSVAGKKTKRAAESGSEEEFKPVKAPTKRKPAAEKVAPAPKAVAKIEELDDDDEPAVVKKKPVASSSKPKKVESDSDVPVVKASVAAKGKGKAIKRKRLGIYYIITFNFTHANRLLQKRGGLGWRAYE